MKRHIYFIQTEYGSKMIHECTMDCNKDIKHPYSKKQDKSVKNNNTLDDPGKTTNANFDTTKVTFIPGNKSFLEGLTALMKSLVKL